MLRSTILNRGFVGCIQLFGCSIFRHIFHKYNGLPLLLPASAAAKSSVSVNTSEENSDNEQFRQEYMTKILMCPKKEMTEFLRLHPHVLMMERRKFLKMVKLLASNSISGQDVLSYPNVFKYKYETVKTRFDSLKQNTDLKSIRLSMVVLSSKEFHRRYEAFIEDTHARDEFQDKCGLLVKFLNCSPKLAKSLVESSKWLEDSKLATIHKKLELYLSIQPKIASHILQKVWLLTFSLSEIELKLNDMKRLEIPIFIWEKSLGQLMKLSGEEYDAYLQKLVTDKSLYGGCISKKEFLCKHLECCEEDISLMVTKYPKLLNVRITKLDRHLKMIRDEFGFSNASIIENPRVFKYSTETLQLRFHELKKLGPTIPNLYAMTKDNRSYLLYMEKLKESFI